MKIPVSELRILIQLLPMIEARVSEAASELREAGDRMVHSIEAGPTWAHLYDLPFREHMMRAAVAFGIDREVVAATHSALPVSAFRDLIAEVEGADIDVEGIEKDQAMRLAWAAFGTSYSLYSSMRSLLTFGLFINELLAVARERRDDKALLNAVRIDPTVLCSRTGAVRLSRATLERDGPFLGAVQRALSGRITKRQDANFQKMRLIVRTLADFGAGRLSDDDLVRLFTRELRLYPSISKRGDVAKNLRKFVDQYMKLATTQNR